MDENCAYHNDAADNKGIHKQVNEYGERATEGSVVRSGFTEISCSANREGNRWLN
jgi:hypothetical protein